MRHWQPELFWDTLSAVDATFRIYQEHAKDLELSALKPFLGLLTLFLSLGLAVWRTVVLAKLIPGA